MADLTCGAGGSTAQEVLTDINANTDAIAALDPKVTQNEADVTTLNALSFFEYDTQVDILDVPETYTLMNDIDIPDLKAGVYMIGISMTYTYNSTTTSAFLRMTINGNPEIFQREPKDNSDRIPIAYGFPYVHALDGAFTLTTEVRKETAANTLDVLFANAVVDRKA